MILGNLRVVLLLLAALLSTAAAVPQGNPTTLSTDLPTDSESETASITVPWDASEEVNVSCVPDAQTDRFRPPVVMQDAGFTLVLKTPSQVSDVDLLMKKDSEPPTRLDGEPSPDGAHYAFYLDSEAGTIIQYAFVLQYGSDAMDCSGGGEAVLPSRFSFRSVTLPTADLEGVDGGALWDAMTQSAMAYADITGSSFEEAEDLCEIPFDGLDPCEIVDQLSGSDAPKTVIVPETIEVTPEGQITTAATCKTLTKTTPSYYLFDPGGNRSLLSLTTSTGEENWPEDEAYQYTSARSIGGHGKAIGRTRLGFAVDLIANDVTEDATLDVKIWHRMQGETRALSHNYDGGQHPFHVDPFTRTFVRYRSGSKTGGNVPVYSANFYRKTVETSPQASLIPGYTDTPHSDSGSYTWSLAAPAGKTTRLIVWADLYVSDYAESAEAVTVAHTQTDFDENTSDAQWNIRTPKSTWTLTSNHYWTSC